MDKARVIVVVAVAAAAGLMLYALIPGLTCGPVTEPGIELVYLHIKVYNMSSQALGLSNRTVVSFVAEVAVRNDGAGPVRLSMVALSLPEYVSRLYEGGSGTYTVTVATTVPGGQAGLSPSMVSEGSFIGALRDVLNYSKELSYSIPPGKELRLIIAGSSLVPIEWEGSLISSWLHGGKWAYVVTTVWVEGCNGGAIPHSLLTNATLTEAGSGEYYYVSGTAPEIINSTVTETLIPG